jgi:hypothetical protein
MTTEFLGEIDHLGRLPANDVLAETFDQIILNHRIGPW